MPYRGIRGATRVEENEALQIIKATQELVLAMTVKNEINLEDISFITFTVTDDLNAAFPAAAVREMGKPWSDLACLDMKAVDIPGEMEKVIRALMVVKTEKNLFQIVHPYLRGTKSLHPDRGWDYEIK